MVDGSEHKKAKWVNKNVVATAIMKIKMFRCIKNVLRHSMKRIQSKDHRIGTYEFNKISSFCFDDKTYIQNNVCDEYSEKLFCQAYCFNFFSSQNIFFEEEIVLIFSLIRTAFLSDIILAWNIKFEKRKAVKIAWHPKIWCNFCVSEDEKKEIEPIFTEGL